MTELTRFKNAIDSDITLRSKYLMLLDKMMTDGEITPEMTSDAAKKLGFDIPASEFQSECDSELSEYELESINGGVSLGGELAPDGKPVGCLYGYYLTWTDYWICNTEQRCPKGGVHDIETIPSGRVCRKCRLGLDERGVIELYDKYGNEVH